MKVLNRKRIALLCAGLGAAGAASAFTLGGTSALYTSQADSQVNSITSGTVVLAEDGTASHSIAQTGFMPGDGACSTAPVGANYVCDKGENLYKVKYTGTNPAFVAMDIAVTSTASQACSTAPASGPVSAADIAGCTGTGSLPLFDGQTGAGDLDISLTPENSDTAHQLVLDSNLVTASACTSAAHVITCTANINNILMPLGSGVGASALQWTNGSADSVHVDTGLPTTAGNQFQGSSVQFTLTSHAVQWDNNNTVVGSGPACSANVTFPAALGSAGTVCPISI